MDIQFEQVTLRYGQTLVLDRISFHVERGQFVLIEGPSGVGKSSLLRLINRLEDPTAGTIRIQGRPIRTWPVVELRRRIAYVPQLPVVLAGSVRENLLLPFRFRANRNLPHPNDEQLRKQLADLLLDDVNLDDRADTLSVGQQQRLSLLRSALIQPQAMLCDEPTASLDAESREVVERTLETWNREQGITIFLVTHQGYRPQEVRPRRFLLTPEHRLKEWNP